MTKELPWWYNEESEAVLNRGYLLHGETVHDAIYRITSAAARRLYRPELQERFAELERSRDIEQYGLSNWELSLVDAGELLAQRLERPDGERFRRPSKRKHAGYFVGDVDKVCHHIYAQLNSEEPLDTSVIRNAVFRSATGSVSYEETQVDAFMDRCIALIQDLP